MSYMNLYCIYALDAFIQSDLKCIYKMYCILSIYVFPGQILDANDLPFFCKDDYRI